MSPQLNGHDTKGFFLGGTIFHHHLGILYLFMTIFFPSIQLMVTCWFGARWFGIPGIPESDSGIVTEGVPRFEGPKPPKIPQVPPRNLGSMVRINGL